MWEGGRLNRERSKTWNERRRRPKKRGSMRADLMDLWGISVQAA